MRFLDIDLDAFLNSVAYWAEGGRLDPEDYIPWREERLRDFLERQCGLSRSAPIKGWFVEEHDGAFDIMRDLVAGGSGPLDVVHVDGHADLGLGDPSWVDLIGHVAKPLAERYHPVRAYQGLNPGSWLAYALAAELIADLTYVHPAGYGDDLQAIHFPGGDTTAGCIEMKAYVRRGLPMNSSVPDYEKLCDLAPDIALARVPFRTATLDDFAVTEPFDAGLLCRSPDFTPATSDALIPVIRDYIDFG